MPKNIEYVTWSAKNVPDGLSFDTETGTFSGELAEEGEYTVPVRVETNYGSDEKDVKIVVESSGGSYPVFAIGKYAATWSNNATPIDDYGWRKLDMPRAKKLVTLYMAFGANISKGQWYVCGNNAKYYGIADTSFTPTTPCALPIDDIVEMAGGSGVSPVYFMYRKNNNEATSVLGTVSGSNISAMSTRTYTDITKLPKQYGPGLIFQRADGGVYVNRGTTIINPTFFPEKPIKALLNHNKISLYLTTNGDFWEYAASGSIRLGEELGAIRDVWARELNPGSSQATSTRELFAQVGNKLYAKGTNGLYELGLPEAKQYTEFTEVGEYDVKKICRNFMLTKDGKLYHTGSSITKITGQHTGGYEQIFPEYKFMDIAFDMYGLTLVALIDDGSTDEPEPTPTEPIEYKYNYIYLHNDDPSTLRIDLHDYLNAWGSNAGICTADAGISSVSYAWCFWDGFRGRYIEDGDSQIISSANSAVATYDSSTGQVVITKNGSYGTGGEVSTYILKVTTNKATEIFHITIYKNPQNVSDETLIMGAEQYPY